MSVRSAQLIVDGNVYTLPVIESTTGEQAIDIRSLLRETGLITLDSGFMNTGSCQSQITYLDGEQGILRYRGYDIADLAARCQFTEVAYLLLNGELPDAEGTIAIPV